MVHILLRILLRAASSPAGRVIRQLPPDIDADILVTKVDYFLRHHYQTPLTRTDLARSLGLGEAHLSRRYAERTGTTPMATLTNIRTNAAARMLEHGLQLKEIALTTGFCDTSHLSRAFTTAFGCSPGEFRRKLDRTDAESLVSLPGSWDYHRNSTALGGTTRLSRATLDARQRNLYTDCWILDAFLTPGVRFRALDETEPWIEESPGWLRLYSPNCPYWEDGARAQTPIISFSLAFSALPSSALAIKYGNGPVCVRFHDPNHRIITRMKQLAFLMQQCAGNAFNESQHIFLKLLLRLTRAQQIAPHTFLVVDRQTGNPIVAQATAYMEAHFAEPLSRERIAAHASVSVSTLAHVYAEEVGEGPMKTLQKIRIRHARVLLGQGMPVARVAESVGFEDAAFFSRVFRQSDRMSPSDYQRLSRG